MAESSGANAVVRCERVCREYRQGSGRVRAVTDVTLSIAPGEVVCILGRSGSGKSSLLNLLGCLDRPTSGEIWIGDAPVAGMSEAERVRIRRTRLGFVFQSLNLLPSLTALENVALPLRYAGVGRERAGRAREMLERVGLRDRADFMPSQLSGGEQQRVALARALVSRPLLVLADEPTGELDSATAADIGQLIREVNQAHGTSFLIVTHDEKLAAAADRALRMEDGRLQGNGG